MDAGPDRRAGHPRRAARDAGLLPGALLVAVRGGARAGRLARRAALRPSNAPPLHHPPGGSPTTSVAVGPPGGRYCVPSSHTAPDRSGPHPSPRPSPNRRCATGTFACFRREVHPRTFRSHPQVPGGTTSRCREHHHVLHTGVSFVSLFRPPVAARRYLAAATSGFILAGILLPGGRRSPARVRRPTRHPTRSPRPRAPSPRATCSRTTSTRARAR